MSVNVDDRLHFELIGAAMAQEKAEQRRDALRGSAAERIATGFVLGAVPRDAATEAALDRRAAAQIGLAQRRLVRPE